MVDALIEEIIAAESREELDVRVRALDRVLRAKQILGAELAQGRVLGRLLGRVRPPDAPPPYARGDAYWWFDQAKYDRLKAEGALR